MEYFSILLNWHKQVSYNLIMKINDTKKLNISSTDWEESAFGMIANSVAASPERSINQACQDWDQSKAAYRFFQNDSIAESKLYASFLPNPDSSKKTDITYIQIKILPLMKNKSLCNGATTLQ